MTQPPEPPVISPLLPFKATILHRRSGSSTIPTSSAITYLANHLPSDSIPVLLLLLCSDTEALRPDSTTNIFPLIPTVTFSFLYFSYFLFGTESCRRMIDINIIRWYTLRIFLKCVKTFFYILEVFLQHLIFIFSISNTNLV